MSLRLIAVLCLLTSPLAGASVPAPRPPVAPDRAGLVADARLLETVYERLHPGLYRYNTPAQVRERFARLRRDLARAPSLPAAYLAFARLAAAIRCGHTYPNFWNQTPEVAAVVFGGMNRVPFHFRWLEGEMIVVDDAMPELPRGTRILAIDGVDTSRILAALMPLVPADGSNDGKRIDELNVLGHDRYEAFDVFYPLVFRVRDGQFRLRVQRPASTAPDDVVVKASTDADRERARPPHDRDDSGWTLSFPGAGQALFTMPTWVRYESRRDWHAELDAVFADLNARGVRLLVIDLRDNGGGSDVGDDLLAHLIHEPLIVADYRERLRYRRVPEALRPYLHTWDRSFFDWGDRARDVDGRFYTRVRADDAPGDRIAPRAPFFAGQVKVLVGPTNSSATFVFASRVKASGLATLVGRTTGGNRRGINGGAFFFLRLPHSGIELDVPLVGQFPVTPQPDEGVAPDIPVRWTVADIVAGRDPDREAAFGATPADGPAL
jgi:hypothetical protein